MLQRIIAVGKLKEKYWQEAVADYVKRLKPYCRPIVAEVPDEKIPDSATSALEMNVMKKEAKYILEKLDKTESFVIALDRMGKSLESKELSTLLKEQIIKGQREITWIIGGPLGLDPCVIKRADLVLSFSKMTFPHQMMRLILLEQIYRSYRIIHNEPYHR
jgi:23S rRNA (pseudouridine1915-N3)-methyltransferase